jgi:hypothetical protein
MRSLMLDERYCGPIACQIKRSNELMRFGSVIAVVIATA